MTTCWVYAGSLTPAGYGVYGRKQKRIHRMMWEAIYGPIPKGHHIHHLCGNKACFNPAHLISLSHSEHTRVHRTGAKWKTCKNGHEFTPENTVWVKGYRRCHTCQKQYQRKYRAKRKEGPR